LRVESRKRTHLSRLSAPCHGRLDRKKTVRHLNFGFSNASDDLICMDFELVHVTLLCA